MAALRLARRQLYRITAAQKLFRHNFHEDAAVATSTPTMTVLQPGQSTVVPVTITPSGATGSVVDGTLYIDALVGGLLPVGGASGVLPAGQIAGVEMAALPYKYTVG